MIIFLSILAYEKKHQCHHLYSVKWTDLQSTDNWLGAPNGDRSPLALISLSISTIVLYRKCNRMCNRKYIQKFNRKCNRKCTRKCTRKLNRKCNRKCNWKTRNWQLTSLPWTVHVHRPVARKLGNNSKQWKTFKNQLIRFSVHERTK